MNVDALYIIERKVVSYTHASMPFQRTYFALVFRAHGVQVR